MTNNEGAGQSAIVTFDYEGSPVAFEQGELMMVNATQMAKPFGKRPIDYLNTQQTKEFLDELAKVRKITLTDLVQVKKGGNNPGTWMHQDVALEFARWLSPKFAIWTNDRIKELLTQGVATVADDDETIARAIGILQNRLADTERRLEASQRLSAQRRGRMDWCLDLCRERLEEMRRDTLLPLSGFLPPHETTFTLTQAAEHLRLRSVHDLTTELSRLGFIRREGKRWLPVDQFTGLFFEVRPYTKHLENGENEELGYAVITQKGLEYFHALFDPAVISSILVDPQPEAVEKGVSHE